MVVPGVSKYLANNSTKNDLFDLFTNDECEIDSDNIEYKENKILDTEIKSEPMDEMDEEDENDADDDSVMKISKTMNNNQEIKRMVQTFSMTNYGLESIIEQIPEKENETENEIKEEKTKKESKSSKTAKPDWHKDYDENELSMIYGYASLSSSALMEKITQIQNYAFQLGLDEEREIARARYLNILNEPDDMNFESNVLLDKEIEEIFNSKNTLNNSNTASPFQS